MQPQPSFPLVKICDDSIIKNLINYKSQGNDSKQLKYILYMLGELFSFYDIFICINIKGFQVKTQLSVCLSLLLHYKCLSKKTTSYAKFLNQFAWLPLVTTGMGES